MRSPASLRPLAVMAGTMTILVHACSDPGTPALAGLEIISGGRAADTIFTRLSAPLVVEYRNSTGQPGAGVPVRFESVTSGTDEPLVGLRRTGGGGDTVFRLAITDTTDANGQVSAFVALGFRAGSAWVRATALDHADSTTYTILPGAPARLALAPPDTAVYVGGTVALRAQAFDSWGNQRTSDIIEWSAAQGVIEGTTPGTFRGVRIGREEVRVRVAELRDSVGINVVPPGTIAAMFFPIAVFEPPYFVLFNTDGTGFQRLNVGADCAHGLQWSPAGDRLLFGRNWAPQVCFTQRIYSTTPAGGVQKIRPDTAPLAGEFWPRMTADGQWIYFSGRPGHQNGEIWRVRPDGTSPERIGPAAGFGDIDQHPSPSPDGTEVVYASTRENETAIFLRVINTTTREVRALGLTGMSPSWSPQGDRIAFLRDDRYYVIAADGSAERGLADSRYSAGMPDPPSWSPDGNWIVGVVTDPGGYAPLYGRLALIEVGTGLVLSLGWTAQLTYPSWRPSVP